MKEKSKALLRNNKNELPAARTLEVSLNRADNVMKGGPPFHATQVTAWYFGMAGGPTRLC
jgi:hypothetical protein